MAGALGRRWKCRSRPCSVCGTWFEPHPRVGRRQKSCGSSACQRELHQRACRDWRAEHPDYDREERLRRKVRPDPDLPAVVEPPAQIDWKAAREAVGLQVAVLIEEVSQITTAWAREAVVVQALGIRGKFGQMRPQVAREEMGATARAP